MNPSPKNIQLMRWRLLGKELRQLLPIFAAVPFALAAFLTLVSGLSLPRELAYQLPGIIFSLGAVGVLVSQEKEQRSLNWLAALPIPALEIVRGKLWAGISGVVLVWLASIVISLVLQPLFPVENGVRAWLLCLLINVYILLVGLAIVWRLESLFASLLILLLVAFVPGGLAHFIDHFVFPASITNSVSDAPLFISYLSFGTIALHLVHRWGQRALTATPTSAPSFDWSWLPYQVSANFSIRAQLMSPAGGLIWQVSRQNRWGFAAVGLILLGSAVLYLFEATALQNRSIWWALLAAWGVSCLGVITFGSDSYRNRVRFLADRGISSWQVWWTRQLVAVSMLSAYCLLLISMTAYADVFSPWSWSIVGQKAVYALVLMLSVYALSQWLGQQIQSVILATVVVPPAAFGVVGMMLWLLDRLGIDWLFLGVLVVVSLFATWWATPNWMDRRLGFRSTANQVAVAAVLLLLAGGIVALPLWTPPRVDPAIVAEMEAFFQRHWRELGNRQVGFGYRDSESIQIFAQRQTIDEESLGVANDFPAALVKELERIEKDLAASDRALTSYLYTSDGLSLELFSKLVAKGKMADAERKSLFNRIMRAHFQLTRRVRQSSQVSDQDTADVGEIWLLQQMLDSDIRQLLDDPLYNEIATYLADDQARQIARCDSVISFWNDLERHELSIWQSRHDRADKYSGIFVRWEPRLTAALTNHQMKSRAVELMELLWTISTGPVPISDETLRNLARNRHVAEMRYGIGPLGPHFRVDDAEKTIAGFTSLRHVWGLPGRNWRAGWETQAKQLQLRVANEPALRTDQSEGAIE